MEIGTNCSIKNYSEHAKLVIFMSKHAGQELPVGKALQMPATSRQTIVSFALIPVVKTDDAADQPPRVMRSENQ